MGRAPMSVCIATALILGAALPVRAGAGAATPFERARELAWAGKHEQARSRCREILAADPAHHDARILLGRTLAWDGRYRQARRQLRTVLSRDPAYTSASRALADVELWDGRPRRALAACNDGLRHRPADAGLRYRKARALEQLGQLEEALAMAQSLAANRRGDERYRRLADRLRVESMDSMVEAGYLHETFEGDVDPWKESYLELRTNRSWGALLGRVRHARRFDERGEQYEIDAYPSLSDRAYTYLNVAWSNDGPYPEVRLGAELHRGFAESWEASLGLRYMDFESTSVRIYTGSLGRYWRAWWFSARPTYTDRERGGAQSLALRARRYFGQGESWLGVEWGLGDEASFDRAGLEEARLNSARARLEGQLEVAGTWLMRGSVGLRERELAGGDNRESTVYRLAIARRF